MRKRRISHLAVLCALLWLCAVAGCGDKKQRLANEQSYRQIGLNQLQAGDYNSAINAFDMALKEHSGRVTDLETDIYFYKAYALIESGDVKAGIETYTDLLEEKKKNADAYYLRGCAYLGSGDTDSALEDFRQAVRYKSDSGELYANICEKLADNGQKDAAEEYLERGLKLKGDEGSDWLNRGRLYLTAGKYKEASDALSKALELEETIAYKYLGKTAQQQGDTARMRSYYEAYSEAYPQDSEILGILGQMELDEGYYDAALAYFEQGLAGTGVANRKMMWSGKIAAMEHTGDFAGAREELEKYLVSYPQDEAAQREYLFLKYR